MNAAQYEAWTRPFRGNAAAIRGLRITNEALKYLCYVLYPLLLVLVACTMPDMLVREIFVPFVLFACVSAFRYVYNKLRPYEALQIAPLISKDTKGKSFPSRHIFSVFMIAMCWLAYCMPVGIILLACGVIMAVIRIIGGVHYPIDVIAGSCIAIIGGFIGLWML